MAADGICSEAAQSDWALTPMYVVLAGKGVSSVFISFVHSEISFRSDSFLSEKSSSTAVEVMKVGTLLFF